jgi:hypothetical protein
MDFIAGEATGKALLTTATKIIPALPGRTSNQSPLG